MRTLARPAPDMGAQPGTSLPVRDLNVPRNLSALALFDARVAAIAGDPESPPEWHERGLCASADPDAFFPEKGGSTRDAKRICRACPVQAECLEYALANQERFGIWGAKSERERRVILGQRGVAVTS